MMKEADTGRESYDPIRAEKLRNLLSLYDEVEAGDDPEVDAEETGLLDPNSEVYEGPPEEILEQLRAEETKRKL